MESKEENTFTYVKSGWVGGGGVVWVSYQILDLCSLVACNIPEHIY
jgi:hypothetical protein